MCLEAKRISVASLLLDDAAGVVDLSAVDLPSLYHRCGSGTLTITVKVLRAPLGCQHPSSARAPRQAAPGGPVQLGSLTQQKP